MNKFKKSFIGLLAGLFCFMAVPATAATWKAMGGCTATTYLGVTASNYTGNIWGGGSLYGVIGANAICVANYGAGARMMTVFDHAMLGRTSMYSADGWIYSPDSGGGVTGSCMGFHSAGGADVGSVLEAIGGVSISGGNCSIARRIHCVR